MLLENFHLVLSDHLPEKPKRKTVESRTKCMEALKKVEGNWNQSNSQREGNSRETKIKSKKKLLEKVD